MQGFFYYICTATIVIGWYIVAWLFGPHWWFFEGNFLQ